jgi:methylmalonyl-CoA epimerase
VHGEANQVTRRRERNQFRLRELIASRFMDHVDRHVLAPGDLDALLGRITDREVDPHTAANRILARALSPTGAGVKATLDHVGIAVGDLAQALAFYRDALGLEVEPPEEVPSQRVRAHLVPVGEATLELLEPTAPDSPIARFIEKRGPGVHHITLRVDDIRAALARLKARGVRLIDEQPRPGAEGALIAFVHPASTHGVLVELTQATED